MPKQWKVLPQQSEDLIEQLLLNRGLKTAEDREKFFKPSLDQFTKDINIPGIPKAWERIQKAIDAQELIVVFGDYDVDGVCASAILYKALTALGAKVLPYIPHREKEGYGLNKQGLEFARDSGAGVVITVDNGIVALEPALYAKELGLDLIITDHHLPLEEKPVSFAIVHSTKMCGAAVAWCLIQDKVSKELRAQLLQFVALATVTDLIPLTYVDRAFVVEGLKQLNKTDNIGLRALFAECGIIPGEFTTFEIGHVIGPRLNAIGRLEHAIDALRLLCTKDITKARKLAKLICETNTQRQKLTVDALEEVKLIVPKLQEKNILILDSPLWVSGIIGLIAGRVTEEYGKPSIAISVGENVSKGSARSIDGVNIVEIIRENCGDILVDVGGHKGAAGFSIANEHIAIFKQKLEQALIDLPKVDPVLEIEAEIPINKLTKKLSLEIEKLAPFGFGNSQPVLLAKRVRVSDIRTLSDGKHLKFKAESIDGIGFGLGSWANLIKNDSLVDIVFNLEINKFNGYENLQLKIKDLKLSEGD